jgi:hypothetical protein
MAMFVFEDNDLTDQQTGVVLLHFIHESLGKAQQHH